MNNVITITTDFGDQFAVAQLHAVLASLRFQGKVIENHSVTPFSVLEGAFQIAVTAQFSPHNTIHVGVIDPGVGSKRRGIIIKTRDFWFVGPDNGLLYPAAIQDSIVSTWQLQETLISNRVSHTFHGRDVFIKAAVYLAQRQLPEAFGCIFMDPQTLQKISFKPGQVLHIDHYGNVKIHWPHSLNGYKTLSIQSPKQTLTIPVVKTFSDVPPHTPLALLGSSDTLELAVNLSRADTFFGCQVGELIKIDYA